MTPKEKAESLIAIMYDVDFWDDEDQSIMQYHHAVKCALIAVDEIINSNPHSNPLNTGVYSTMNYWRQVKTEIEKL